MTQGNTGIQAFNALGAVDAIREKIRGALYDAIPQEQWDALIKAEMKDFMTDIPPDSRDFGRKAGFKQLVRGLLQEEATKSVRAFLETDEWKGLWDERSKGAISEGIKKMLIENSAEIFSNILARSFQETLEVMRMRR